MRQYKNYLLSIILGFGAISITAQDCEILQLTGINGNPCRRLFLTMNVDDAISYQWYKDGNLLSQQTSPTIEIDKHYPLGEGTYHVEALTDDKCYESEPYIVENTTYETDLGIIQLCPGDTVLIGGFHFYRPGFQRFKTTSAEGCDSTIIAQIVNDECICTNILPLTKVDDYPCTRTDLTLEVEAATSYQWYKNGIALNGQTESEIEVNKILPLGNGLYQVHVETPEGCVASEPYLVERNENIIDLGTLYFCSNEDFLLADLPMRDGSGCDTTFRYEVVIYNPVTVFNDTTLTLGTKFTSESGNVNTYLPGIFQDTIQTVAGCDSVIIIYNIDFMGECDLMPFTNVEGSACTQLKLEFDLPDQTFIQWYRGDYPLDNQNSTELTIESSFDLTIETYKAWVVTADGCFTSPTYRVEREDKFTDLGITYYCPEDVEPDYPTGTYSVALPTVDGCDSIVMQTFIAYDRPVRIDHYDSLFVGEVFISEYSDLQATESGLYSEIVQGVSGCDSLIMNYYLTFTENSSSNKNRLEDKQFSFYPNPISKENGLTIYFEETLLDNANLSVIDISGRLAYNKYLPQGSDRINFSGLETGVYFLVIESAHNRIFKKIQIID